MQDYPLLPGTPKGPCLKNNLPRGSPARQWLKDLEVKGNKLEEKLSDFNIES